MDPNNLPLDPTARQRVNDPIPIPTTCPNCGAEVKLVKNSEIYNGREFGKWPYAYLCVDRENCNSYVGLHPGTDIPLGVLADDATRLARRKAKEYFQPLWRGKRTRFRERTEAYQWLADELGIPFEECHFGWFDEDMAVRAERICKREALR